MHSPRKSPAILKEEKVVQSISDTFEFYKRPSAIRSSELEKELEDKENEKNSNNNTEDTSSPTTVDKNNSHGVISSGRSTATSQLVHCEDLPLGTDSNNEVDDETESTADQNKNKNDANSSDESDDEVSDKFVHETSLSGLSHKTLMVKNIIKSSSTKTSNSNNSNNNNNNNINKIISNRLFVSIYDPVYSEEDRAILAKMVKSKKYTSFNPLDEDEEILNSTEPIERWDHEITVKTEMVCKKVKFDLGTFAYTLTLDDAVRFQFENKDERDQLEAIVNGFLLYLRSPQEYAASMAEDDEDAPNDQGKHSNNNLKSATSSSSSPRKSKTAKKEVSPPPNLKQVSGKKKIE